MNGHDIVVRTNGEPLPTVRGCTIDEFELMIPRGSTIAIEADEAGLMTVTFTVFARSFHTVEVTA